MVQNYNNHIFFGSVETTKSTITYFYGVINSLF